MFCEERKENFKNNDNINNIQTTTVINKKETDNVLLNISLLKPTFSIRNLENNPVISNNINNNSSSQSINLKNILKSENTNVVKINNSPPLDIYHTIKSMSATNKTYDLCQCLRDFTMKALPFLFSKKSEFYITRENLIKKINYSLTIESILEKFYAIELIYEQMLSDYPLEKQKGVKYKFEDCFLNKLTSTSESTFDRIFDIIQKDIEYIVHDR